MTAVEYSFNTSGCGVGEAGFQQKSSTLRRSKRRGRQTAGVRNFSKQTC